jgi:hypothetical protein
MKTRISLGLLALLRDSKSVHRSPEYECGKRNPLYPIRSASFVSIVVYLMHIFIHILFFNSIILNLVSKTFVSLQIIVSYYNVSSSDTNSNNAWNLLRRNDNIYCMHAQDVCFNPKIQLQLY